MADEYYIKPEFKGRRLLIHSMGEEAINLIGEDVEKIIPGSKDAAPKKVIIRGATQDDLKNLFEIEKHGNVSRLIGKRSKKTATAPAKAT
jgi:hypothetical protein